jgi:hypothetical protein
MHFAKQQTRTVQELAVLPWQLFPLDCTQAEPRQPCSVAVALTAMTDAISLAVLP